MTTTVNLRKVLDRKEWEMMTPAPTASVAGSYIVSSSLANQLQLYMQAGTVHYLYRPDEDAWIQIPSGVFGTQAAGSCGTHHPNGPNGTATAGGASTLTTSLTIPGSLVGYKIRLTGGPGAGDERTIIQNTNGANAVLTVDSPFSATPTTGTTYLLLTGRFYCLGASGAALTFKYYDVATNIWSSALGVSGPSATWATDGRLIATAPDDVNSFASGTATAGAGTTLTNSAKAWATNQWANYQVRLTGGTGVGQVRTIASNTGTVITVSAAWTVNPDATSTYVIEGNDDFLYFTGNNATLFWRYSISLNTWSAMTARPGGGAGLGLGGNWIHSITNDPAWSNENAIINGRRIYSFRGAATATLDYYDIPSNAWTTVTYQRQQETFSTGTSWAYGKEYIYCQKDATGRFFRFDVARHTLDPWSMLLYTQGTAVIGDKMFDVTYTDGGTVIRWIYNLRNTGAELFRCMVI